MVTVISSRIRPPPSTRAASYSELGICWIPATKSTMHRPISIHAPIIPMAGSAQVKSPSQGRASSPRPMARRDSLNGPSVA